MKQFCQSQKYSRKRSTVLPLLFLLVLPAATFFSSPVACEEWENYYRIPRQIYDLAIEENGLPEGCDYYVWNATEVGVFRLDPCSGEYIRYSYADGLIHNATRVITIDDTGNKWIGTSLSTETGWMSRFDDDAWTTHNPPGPSVVNAITFDGLGHVWVGRGDEFSTIFGYGGLNVFDGGEWTVYNSGNSGLNTDYVTAVAIDAGGDKWIGTSAVPIWIIIRPGGVNHFDGSNWTTYDRTNSDMTGQFLSDIAIDSLQNKWVATLQRGVFQYDGANWFNFTVDDGLPSNNIQTITADNEDAIWIGTVMDGAALHDGVALHLFNTGNSGLVNDNVHDIAIYQPEGAAGDDREAWFATGDGVCLLTSLGWTSYSLGGIFDTTYKDVHVDTAGTTWFTTNDGVVVYDGNDWTRYHTGNSDLPSDNVQSLVADGDGQTWIGTDAGLNRHDGFSWTLYDTDNSELASNNVKTLAVDGPDHIWVGTDAGLNHFDGTDWITYHIGNSGLASDNVRALASDGVGRVWVGADAGLNYFDGTAWMTYNTDNSDLSSNNARALASDGAGRVWVGTDAGLNYFDGTAWIIYNADNSDLPNNIIRAIDVDAYNQTWVATDRELGRFDGVGWKIYQSGDGLGDRTVNGIFADDASDSVWFATGSGASRMAPTAATEENDSTDFSVYIRLYENTQADSDETTSDEPDETDDEPDETDDEPDEVIDDPNETTDSIDTINLESEKLDIGCFIRTI